MTNYNYDALEKRLRDGAAPLNDPDLNDEAADAIRDLRAERDALRGLLIEVRGTNKRLGWIDCLESYYYGPDHAEFCTRLDAALAAQEQEP